MTLPLNTAPGPSPDEESECHALISRDFLVKAREELEKGELLQASEKAWGAAAHAIKAVAEKRRWFSEADWKLHQIANIISAEQQDETITWAYMAVRDSHFNFYRHEYDALDVEDAIRAAASLVGKMDFALAQPAPYPVLGERLEARKSSLEQPTSDPDRDRLTNGRPPMEQRPPAVSPQE